MHTPGTNKELDAGPCLHLDGLCWVGREARPHWCPVVLVKVPGFHPVRKQLCVAEGAWQEGQPSPLELTLIYFLF